MIQNVLIFLFSYQITISIATLQFNLYTNSIMALVLISKIAILFSIFGILWELTIYSMNYQYTKYRYKELEEKVYKIYDSRKITIELLIVNFVLLLVSLVIMFMMGKEGKNNFINPLYLQLFVAEIYFIFKSFNNANIRNGIYSNGIFYMGQPYRWDEIDDIKVKREKKEFHIIRFDQGIFLGDSIIKIKYSENNCINYVEKQWKDLKNR